MAPSLKEDDSIYDYGASSLTVIAVQSELNELFHCAVDPVELAEATTPLDWAAVYERQGDPQPPGAERTRQTKEEL